MGGRGRQNSDTLAWPLHGDGGLAGKRDQTLRCEAHDSRFTDLAARLQDRHKVRLPSAAPRRPWSYPVARLEVARQPAVEEVVSQEEGEQKSFHGLRLMLIDVIGVPAIDQLVKALVFDIPARVPPTHHGGGRHDRSR